MKTYIYILRHPETFEVKYVGKTNNVKRRFAQHKSKKCLEKTGSKKLASWILNLLSNNLLPIMEIIEECNDNWSERERYWISFYSIDTLCNLSEGGEGVGHNDYTKSKIKYALIGRKRSDEQKQAISKAMTGVKRGKYTNTEGHKKRYEDPEERKKCAIKLRKKVFQYSLDGFFIKEWNSGREAARELNICNTAISYAARNKNYSKSANGFLWSFDKLIKHEGSFGNNTISILQCDINGDSLKEWTSICLAAKELNISKSGIIRCCKGKQKQCGGFTFKYITNENI